MHLSLTVQVRPRRVVLGSGGHSVMVVRGSVVLVVVVVVKTKRK
jgi:hypothetical protein